MRSDADPWLDTHTRPQIVTHGVAALGPPGTGPLRPHDSDPEQSLNMSTGLQPSWRRIPIVIVPILAHGERQVPLATEVHLVYLRRGPGDQAGSASPSLCGPPAAITSRPTPPRLGRPDDISSEQVGHAYPATPRCSPSGDANGVRLEFPREATHSTYDTKGRGRKFHNYRFQEILNRHFQG